MESSRLGASSYSSGRRPWFGSKWELAICRTPEFTQCRLMSSNDSGAPGNDMRVPGSPAEPGFQRAFDDAFSFLASLEFRWELNSVDIELARDRVPYRYADCGEIDPRLEQEAIEVAEAVAQQRFLDCHVFQRDHLGGLLPYVGEDERLALLSFCRLCSSLLDGAGGLAIADSPVCMGWAESGMRSAALELHLALTVARADCLGAWGDGGGVQHGTVSGDVPGPETAGRMAATDRYSLLRTGKLWTLVFAGKGQIVSHSLGLEYIVTLIRNQGRTVPAIELESPNGYLLPGGADEAVDEGARRAYSKRLEELAGELTHAQDAGDATRVEQLKAEAESVATHLSAGTGLAGRARLFGGEEEAARSRVKGNLARALIKLKREHPEAHEHFDRYIHGKSSSSPGYLPARGIPWELDP